MSRIKEVINEIVDNISNKVIVSGWVDNLNGTFTAITSNTLWCIAYDEVVIDSVDFDVSSVLINDSITIKSQTLPTSNEIFIPKLNFIHGTIKQTNAELDIREDLSPFVYLLESVREKRFLKKSSSIDRESTVTLFFLRSVSFENWITNDYHTEVFDPMEQAVNGFIDQLPNANANEPETVDSVNIAKFATENKEGYLKWLFDDQFGGIQVTMTLPLRKISNCTIK